ncbi:Ig-like domain-containing protein, partial [uncultured Thomasclavelia sp.]|uniref:Ig-like domain-containing protein n=1 Tax=uncultured Thomasclavelia sp. TaxID=3025759 RepID=UPI0025D3F81B
MKVRLKRILAFGLVFMMVFSNQVYALEDDVTDEKIEQYSYTVSDDPNFVDGTMSNPDGYENSGVEIDTDGNTDVIHQSKARGSGYDLTWTTENGVKVMYDGDGKRFGYGECKKVIDVSSHNGGINWTAVKNDGVDGAILRITSFAGGSMHEDDYFASNLAGCRQNNIPFGVYMYSYADNTTDASNEANYVVSLLQKYNVRPSEMGYSVYYDLESNNSNKNNSLATNIAIVQTFVNILSSNGYPVNVYSYKSYLEEKLNSPEIYKYVSWVAQYGMRLSFVNNYYTGNYGWQYRSNGSVAGVNGEVDVSCFSNFYGYDTENHVGAPLGRDTTTPYLEYRANSEKVGWLPYFIEPNTAGTTGRSFPLYQLQIKLNNVLNSAHLSGTIKNTAGTIEYQNIENSTVLGTQDKAMRQVKFSLDNVPGYHLEYRVHSADIGWQDWVVEGNYAGNSSKDIQAIDFRLVADDSEVVKYPQIYYRGHIADTGWLEYVPDSQTAGQPGSGVALQALNIGFDNPEEDYSLSGSVYVEGLGWQDYSTINSNTTFGTTGQARTIKGIKLNLEDMPGYSMQYRVYITGQGWQSWMSENEIAGNTTNNIEAVQIKMNYDNSKIEKIVLDKTDITMDVDTNDKISATVKPIDTVMDKTLSWTSSNPSIVSVDQNGNIVSYAAGTATITATTVNGLSANCKVTVIIPITEITLNETAITLEKGDSKTLKATIEPENTTLDKTISWSSENEQVAKVNQNGKVTAVDAGTTNIVATASNGVTTKCSITVTSKITSISLNKSELQLQVSKNQTLEATINPSNTTDDKTLTWKSSDTDIATVDNNGKVTAQNIGTATITVTASNGISASCKVTVVKQIPTITYRTHVQDDGWQGYVEEGETSGTTNQKKRLEAIEIKLDSNETYTGSIKYQTHIQDIGWQDWVEDGTVSGTEGQSKRLEAIKIKLTDELEENFDVYYRVHVQELGWMDWAKNGESAGTAGYSYRLEAIEIKIVPKGDDAPGSTDTPFKQHYVKYATHVQDIGWLGNVYDGNVSGTEGQSKRLEAITIKLDNPQYSGSIRYRTHIQDIGWQSWRADGAMAGTSGQSKRLEAIEIDLTGEMASHYDIYYRV